MSHWSKVKRSGGGLKVRGFSLDTVQREAMTGTEMFTYKLWSMVSSRAPRTVFKISFLRILQSVSAQIWRFILLNDWVFFASMECVHIQSYTGCLSQNPKKKDRTRSSFIEILPETSSNFSLYPFPLYLPEYKWVHKNFFDSGGWLGVINPF